MGANDKAQPVSNCMQNSSFSICKGTEISEVNNELTSNTVNKSSSRNTASEFYVLPFLQKRAIWPVRLHLLQTTFRNLHWFHNVATEHYKQKHSLPSLLLHIFFLNTTTRFTRENHDIIQLQYSTILTNKSRSTHMSDFVRLRMRQSLSRNN